MAAIGEATITVRPHLDLGALEAQLEAMLDFVRQMRQAAAEADEE